MSTTPNETAPPRRGRPPRIGRAQIVEAARTLDPETLTMQAVADQLGVDRKALNYYVSDRDGLLELVATSAFHMELNAAEFDAPGDWREAARNFATATRNGVISTGVLASYVRFDSAADLGALAPAETLLESLLDAGFDDVAAGRFLAFLAEFVYTSARNVIAKTARGEHPQRPELVRALSDAGEEEFSAMKRLMESGLDQFDDAQFEFGLQVAIRGMEPLLAH